MVESDGIRRDLRVRHHGNAYLVGLALSPAKKKQSGGMQSTHRRPDSTIQSRPLFSGQTADQTLDDGLGHVLLRRNFAPSLDVLR